MNKPSLDVRWHLGPLRALILENRRLCAVVLPEYGRRIWSIRYKPLDRELLWQSPRIPAHKPAFGAVYDDTWSGGWDEVFPNDAPGVILGERYPDHGELWASEWDWEAEEDDDAVTVRLRCRAAISAFEIEKSITLRADHARLAVDYKIVNCSGGRMPFLFKAHPAFAVEPGWRLDFPAMKLRLDPGAMGSLAGADLESEWPFVMRGRERLCLAEALPQSARQFYFFYGSGYEQGWCAVTDPVARLSAGLVFPAKALPCCWLFASYGGWRNNMLALVEPATGWPVEIERAIEQGSVSDLAAGGAMEFSAVFQVQEGLQRVAGLSPEAQFLG